MDTLILSAAVFAGAVVSSFSGFAFSAVAGAILLHTYDPMTTISIMMACSIISQVTTLVILRKSVPFASGTPLLIGGAVGVALAVQIVRWADPAILKPAFGAFLTLYAAYALLRSRRQHVRLEGPVHSCAVGALGGAVGAFTAMPGAIPALWCELRGLTKEQQRGITQPFTIAMQILALALFAATAGVPPAAPRHVLIAMPALLAGIFVGLFAFRKVDDQLFRRIVLVLLIASGLALMC